MTKYRQKAANGNQQKSRGYFSLHAIVLSCLAASLVILGGRLTLASTSASLGGWTALLFTALCVGLALFNLLAEHPFTSQRQMLTLILGSLSGTMTLAFLEYNLDSAGDLFLFGTGFLLAISLVGLNHQKPHPQAFQTRCLANWALRLDALLKYDVPTASRNALSQLIDELWRSPEDHADFIPAQNALFANLLAYLELVVRQGDIEATTKTLTDLARCLKMRNQILGTSIKIEYNDAKNKAPGPSGILANERSTKSS